MIIDGKKLERSCYCGDLRGSDVGKKVVLTGWVHHKRDLPSCIFIVLRDRSGVVQLVIDPNVSKEAYELAQNVRNEFCLCAEGEVISRGDNINKDQATGEIEIKVTTLHIVSSCPVLPFNLKDAADAKEETRLKYRYLDLRRPELAEKFLFRHKFNQVVRRHMSENGFAELETPYLINSTPEGARDFVVPSRKYAGHFFALPQSPQLFKQLFMIAGFDRYFQIVRCFRDEDLRADRQPEFTQIDMEMSFIDEDEIMGFVETLIAKIWELIGVKVTLPIKHMTYAESMDRFGVDAPDLRYGLELKNLNDVLAGTSFGVFQNVLAEKGLIKAICVPNCSFSRKEIDGLAAVVEPYGAKGVMSAKVGAGNTISGSLAKQLSAEEQAALCARMEAKEGDLILIVAASAKVTTASLGALRKYLANKLGLTDKNRYEFVWITDFPLLEWDDEEGRYVAAHHPFTSPKLDQLHLLETDPGKVLARAYDIVCNGYEIGGGSIRINDPEVQRLMFKTLGITPEAVKRKFGYFVEALNYGAPIHGGLALGADRVAMLLTKTDAIRDVIAFPKTQKATDLMLEAPTLLESDQLEELHLEVAKDSAEE